MAAGLLVPIVKAEQIRKVRKARGQTARQFADEIGVSWRTFQGWEQGRKISPMGKLLLSKAVK